MTTADANDRTMPEDIFVVSNEVEEIDCDAARCPGCENVHRRETGVRRVTYESNGVAFAGVLASGEWQWLA